jgi:hypothetical protein
MKDTLAYQKAFQNYSDDPKDNSDPDDGGKSDPDGGGTGG